ncbi:MAG: hypothetical protein ACREI9_08435 [Nitrospiraceae bacterium]
MGNHRVANCAVRLDEWMHDIPVARRHPDWDLLIGKCQRAVQIPRGIVVKVPADVTLYRPCPNPLKTGIQCEYHRAMEAEAIVAREGRELQRAVEVRSAAWGMGAVVTGSFLLVAVVTGWVLFGIEAYWWVRWMIVKGGVLPRLW